MAQSVALNYKYNVNPNENQVRRPTEDPRLRVVRGQRQSTSPTFSLKTIFIVLLVLLVIFAIVYENMKLAELSTQIDNANKEYISLLSENKRMQVELENKASLETIRQRAEELGMAEAEAYQIGQLSLKENEDIVFDEKRSNVIREAAVSFIGLFDRIDQDR